MKRFLILVENYKLLHILESFPEGSVEAIKMKMLFQTINMIISSTLTLSDPNYYPFIAT